MKKTILIVDDDEALLKTLRDILELEGYSVETLSDPLRTEEYLRDHNVVLLIIDVFMPGRSGFHLVEDLSRNVKYRDIPIIFLTCLDDDVERMTARACGVSRYVTKPFSPESVIEHVRELAGTS